MSEADEDRIKAIGVWATNHNKGTQELIPRIGLKYIEDLLEYIEDMRLLEKQTEMSKVRDRIRKDLKKTIAAELMILEAKTKAEYAESLIFEKVEEEKKGFHDLIMTEEGAIPYLILIPLKYIFKSLWLR